MNSPVVIDDATPTQEVLFGRGWSAADAVYTPDWCAADMVAWFKPCGRTLEPAKGGGAILKHLPANAEWCEITEGRDFFDWIEPVDWIVSNPPYSSLRPWLAHSLNVAQNIVYLLPLKNIFSAYGQMSEIRARGWIKHIRVYGTGALLGFPMGNACGAFHFLRGYRGDTGWSFFCEEKS